MLMTAIKEAPAARRQKLHILERPPGAEDIRWALAGTTRLVDLPVLEGIRKTNTDRIPSSEQDRKPLMTASRVVERGVVRANACEKS